MHDAVLRKESVMNIEQLFDFGSLKNAKFDVSKNWPLTLSDKRIISFVAKAYAFSEDQKEVDIITSDDKIFKAKINVSVEDGRLFKFLSSIVGMKLTFEKGVLSEIEAISVEKAKETISSKTRTRSCSERMIFNP